MRLALKSAGTAQYYFRDQLTAAALFDSIVVTIERSKIRVITSGASQRRTVEGSLGSPVKIAIGASWEKIREDVPRLSGKIDRRIGRATGFHSSKDINCDMCGSFWVLNGALTLMKNRPVQACFRDRTLHEK